jgi:hypothetical protein
MTQEVFKSHLTKGVLLLNGILDDPMSLCADFFREFLVQPHIFLSEELIYVFESRATDHSSSGDSV